MKVNNEKLIIRRIEESINNRPDNFYYSNKPFKIILWASIIFLIINFSNLILIELISYRVDRYSIIELSKIAINLLSMVIFVFYFYLRTLEAPKEKQNKDKWLWKKGRLLVLLQILYPIFLCLSLLINFNAFTGYNLIESNVLIILILGLIGYSIYSIIILLIAFRPKLIFSSRLNSMGVTFHLMQFIVMVIILLKLYNNKFISLIFFVIFLIIILSLIYKHSQYFFNKKELALTQKYALDIISPFKLSELITSKNKELNLRIEAIDYIKRKYSNNQYAFLNILNKELLREINGSTKSNFLWIISMILPIAYFVFGSIGEGLLQDIFNDSIKQKLCTYFGILCS